MGKICVATRLQKSLMDKREGSTNRESHLKPAIRKPELRKTAKNSVYKASRDQKPIKNELQAIQRSIKFSKTIDLDSLECSICLELLVEPVILVCNHSFCSRCLEQNRAAKAFSERCPLCRRECWLEQAQNSSVLTKLIEAYLINNQEEVIPYTCRKADHLEWLRKRKDIDIFIGAPVDYQDHSGRWYYGTVAKLQTIAQMRIIDVAPQGRIGDQNEYHRFHNKTHRLAPPLFFSQRTNLKLQSLLFDSEENVGQLIYPRNGDDYDLVNRVEASQNIAEADPEAQSPLRIFDGILPEFDFLD